MLTVKEIMTRPVVVIHSSATVEDAILLMRAKRVRSLIVADPDDEMYGIVTEKDIVFNVIAWGDAPGNIRVETIMQKPCICVPVDATLQEAAQILAEADIHRAPVTQNGRLLGLVSVTDILVKGQSTSSHRDKLSQRIQKDIQHARIIDDEATAIRQECDIAWNVYESVQAEDNSQKVEL